MWMSEARDLYASTMIWFASRMTALSFSSSSPPLRSSESPTSSARRSPRIVPIASFPASAAAHLPQKRQDVLPQSDRPLDLPVLQRLGDAVDLAAGLAGCR
jgi:hypothetical protein